MSEDDRRPAETEDGTVARTTTRRAGGKRQPLSCLPCRSHKLRCDRRVPCGTCTRYNRETQCRQNPAPPRRDKRTRYSTGAARPQSPRLPVAELSPLSTIGGEGPEGDVLSPELEQAEDGNDDFTTVPHDHQRLASPCSVTDGLSVLAAFDMERTTWPSLPQLLAQAARGEQTTPAWRAMIDSQFRRRLSQRQLSSVLPSRPQCDLLLNFFLEHVNWIFQTVHEPSFRREYARFWEDGLEQTDFIWSSLLFTMISVSALYVPVEAMDVVGLPREATRNLAHIWHLASLHALRAGEFESRPCLTQLQTFSITQLYWYATNQVETLNSRLGLAVKTAHALRMERDTSPSRNLADEMRHRIWWELVDADMFQTVCLDRPPLIRLGSRGVPLPVNCHDTDLAETSIRARPLDEPTEISMNIFRARTFRILNRDYFAQPDSRPGGTRRSYESIQALDAQILALTDSLPWYFQLDAAGRPPSPPRLAEPLNERTTWQHHILRTCISTQRIRMYRQHLHPRTGAAWSHCVSAARDSLLVYRALRARTTRTSRQKFLPQAYQIFSVAATVTALLLVEGSLPIEEVYQQVRDMVGDLGMLERQGSDVPVARHGRRVLRRMLDLCEARATARGAASPEEAQSLVPDIATVLGGESTARAYLGRLRDAGQAADANDTETRREGRVGDPEALVGGGGGGGGQERAAAWDDASAVGFGPGLSPPHSSHVTFPGSFMDMDIDPDMLLEDTRRMGLLNWDMTGLLALDSLDG